MPSMHFMQAHIGPFVSWKRKPAMANWEHEKQNKNTEEEEEEEKTAAAVA